VIGVNGSIDKIREWMLNIVDKSIDPMLVFDGRQIIYYDVIKSKLCE
jgi:hypothetical protein